MTIFVALYCRISKDKRGRVEGVKAQEKWGRDYAASAWPTLPVRVYADNDLSAANGDHRPRYEALREAVGHGEVAHLWAVEQSRLERREVEWFRLAAELDAAGITELHTNRDGIVRVRDEIAGIKAVLNAGEVRKLKRRVNDRLAEIAAEGRPAGARVYGYRHGVDPDGGKTLLIVEEEAAVIRECAEWVLSGWSLSSIAKDLRERGLHGPHQRKIRDSAGEVVGARPSRVTNQSVKSFVTSPTVAGKRVHQGRIVGDGVWEPILDEQTWNAVRDKLAGARVVDRSDGGTYPVPVYHRSTGRRYLLTGGTAVCGVCHYPLVASLKQLHNGSSKPYYLCHPKTGGKACVGIMGPELEVYVVDQLLDELDKPAFLEALATDEYADRREEILAALAACEHQRNELANMWAAKDLTAAEWQTARRALAEHEQQLRADHAALPPSLSRVDPGLIRTGWGAMTLDERREIVSMFVEKVTVKRAKPGTKGFDSRRVAIEWRQR